MVPGTEQNRTEITEWGAAWPAGLGPDPGQEAGCGGAPGAKSVPCVTGSQSWAHCVKDL